MARILRQILSSANKIIGFKNLYQNPGDGLIVLPKSQNNTQSAADSAGGHTRSCLQWVEDGMERRLLNRSEDFTL